MGIVFYLGRCALVREFWLECLRILTQGVLNRLLSSCEVSRIIETFNATTPFIAEETSRKTLAVHLQAFALLALAALRARHVGDLVLT